MELLYKPDMERAQTYWRAYWDHQIIDRPVVVAWAPKDPAHPVKRPSLLTRSGGDYAAALARFEHWAANTYFAGEAVPSMDCWFGPDQMAAFMGAPLTYAEDDETSWTTPIVTDWNKVRLALDETPGTPWPELLKFIRLAAAQGAGKYILSTLDMHTNMDAIRGLRGTQEMCFDAIDHAAELDEAMRQVRALYAPVYEGVYEAGRMAERGTYSWLSAYCEQRFATTECDVICLFSVKHARRFILPALEEEFEYLDHTIYHFDGPSALHHMDDILAFKKIDAIQWVPGDGQPKTFEWMDLLHKIQAAGKGLYLYDWSVDDIKQHYHELKPEGVLFNLTLDTPQQADELIEWLAAHT
ncbi:MAG: hypothetical protein IT317_15110 [Anaerolineales bacterium]|nr:hypothetical protein [Anaerolineales bacterium]